MKLSWKTGGEKTCNSTISKQNQSRYMWSGGVRWCHRGINYQLLYALKEKKWEHLFKRGITEMYWGCGGTSSLTASNSIDLFPRGILAPRSSVPPAPSHPSAMVKPHLPRLISQALHPHGKCCWEDVLPLLVSVEEGVGRPCLRCLSCTAAVAAGWIHHSSLTAPPLQVPVSARSRSRNNTLMSVTDSRSEKS